MTSYMTVHATKEARQVYVKIDMLRLTEPIRQDAKESGTKCIKGIPKDASFFRAIARGIEQNLVILIFEHESFDIVRVGSPIPIFELEFEEI